LRGGGLVDRRCVAVELARPPDGLGHLFGHQIVERALRAWFGLKTLSSTLSVSRSFRRIKPD
jgi:hypothetical protein